MKQSKPRISCVPFRCVCKGEPSQQIFVLWFEDTLDLMVWHKFDFCYLLILFLSSVPFGLPFCPGLCRQSFGKSISATANVHTSMTSTTNFRFLCSTFVFVSFLSIKLRGLYAGEFFFIYYLLTLRFQMANFCIKYCSEEQRKKIPYISCNIIVDIYIIFCCFSPRCLSLLGYSKRCLSECLNALT